MTGRAINLVATLEYVGRELRAVDAARVRLQATHAPLFNPFEVMSPGETALSRVIAWMVAPSESHGQGDRFLRLFLATFCPDLLFTEHDLSSVRVEVESATVNVSGSTDRRIDIRINARAFTIGIENKPWAGWQVDQLRCYWEDIDAYRHQQTPVDGAPECYLIAFIGGSGDPDVEVLRHWTRDRGGIDPDRGEKPPPANVAGFDFVGLAQWVEDCIASTRPPDVASFLRGFADYCRHTIGGRGLTVSDRAVIDAILKNASRRDELLEAAFALEQSMPDVRDALAEEVAVALRPMLAPATVVRAQAPYSPMAGLSVRAQGAAPSISVALFGPPGYRPWFGLARDKNEDAPLDLIGRMKGSSSMSPGTWHDNELKWHIWRHLREEDVNGTPETLWLMNPHHLAEALDKLLAPLVR